MCETFYLREFFNKTFKTYKSMFVKEFLNSLNKNYLIKPIELFFLNFKLSFDK